MAILTQNRSALWDQVWAEYDVRRGKAPAPPPRPQAPAGRSRRGAAWGRRLRGLAALGIVCGATAFATAPILTAARVGQALAAGDVAGLEAAVDWQTLSPALRQGMDAAVRDSGGGAAAFLAGMADEMAQGMATPQGLLAVMRERLPAGTGVGGMAMIGAIRPVEGGRWQVALHAPGESREALTVTLALRDALSWRWRVVGVEVPAALQERG